MSKEEMKKGSSIVWFFVGLGLVIGLWYWNYSVLVDEHDRGTFGDMFGTINSLFTGFTFAGLIYTIILQRQQMGQQMLEIEISQKALDATIKTLDLTREQLQLTKDELVISNKEFKQQNETLRHQQFETTFFNLLNYTKGTLEEARRLEHFNTPAHLQKIHNHWKAFKLQPPEEQERLFTAAYNDTIELKSHDLQSVIRTLASLIRYVIDADIKQHKGLYLSTIQSLLSNTDVTFLFYHSFYFSGAPVIGLKDLLKNGLFISRIDKKSLVAPEHYDKFISVHSTSIKPLSNNATDQPTG